MTPTRRRRSTSSAASWCGSRSSCACSRATRRWRTTSPCATRAPTSSTVPTPRGAGWCCGRGRRSRSRTAGSRSGASSSTWRTRAAPGLRPGAGPGGPDRDQRLQQCRRGPRQPVQGRAGQAPGRLTAGNRAPPSRLFRPVDRPGRGRSWPTTAGSTSPASRSRAGCGQLGGAGACPRLPVAHPHRAGPQPGYRRPVDLRPGTPGALPRPPGGVLGGGRIRHHRRRRVHHRGRHRVQQLRSRPGGGGGARARVHAHAGEEDLAGRSHDPTRGGPRPHPLRSSELLGKTLGIVGVGQIGGRLVELCAPFAMTVLAYDPYLAERARGRGGTKVELDELLERSDFVHLNCPLTPSDEGPMVASSSPVNDRSFVTTARGRWTTRPRSTTRWWPARSRARASTCSTSSPPTRAPAVRARHGRREPARRGDHGRGDARHRVATADQWITIFAGKGPPRLINPEAWPAYSDRFHARFGMHPEEPVL